LSMRLILAFPMINAYVFGLLKVEK
jgi:hypothetical protein